LGTESPVQDAVREFERDPRVGWPAGS